MTTILVTGAAGFIGVNTVAWLLREQPQVTVISYDAFTYAAHPESLAMVTAGHESRHFLIRADVRDGDALRRVLAGEARDAAGRAVPRPDTVWHLAAETHVDRSILDPAVFVDTNVIGTLRLLEALRERGDAGQSLRCVHVSTDEVYGSLGPDEARFTESRALSPSSPYAASKAAADLLVQGWAQTFGINAVITRCSNNYGPFQFPEKLIPLMVTRALAGESLPVYGDGRQVRDWLHVSDHAAALWAVSESKASGGHVFNIGADGERENLAVVHSILDALGRDHSLVSHVRDRPAHDRRYGMDATRLRAELGWSPRVPFERGLAETVQWYVEHEAWWRAVQREASRAAEALYVTPRA
ncbi:MAG: dTDP-glucose 4,6-dehydratase [Gemmatimonadaceae bacterium]|nr:dTDP-glucose 4,6-dehydratase [Gemmatimonadaceae bacterium]